MILDTRVAIRFNRRKKKKRSREGKCHKNRSKWVNVKDIILF